MSGPACPWCGESLAIAAAPPGWWCAACERGVTESDLDDAAGEAYAASCLANVAAGTGSAEQMATARRQHAGAHAR